jgi:hypothetical protein
LLFQLALVGLSADVAPSIYDNPDAIPIATGDSALKIKISRLTSIALIVFRDGAISQHSPTIEAIGALLGNHPFTLGAGNTGNILVAMRAFHIVSPVLLRIYSSVGISCCSAIAAEEKEKQTLCVFNPYVAYCQSSST